MNEAVFREILGESLKNEYAGYDNAPEHKFSLRHRLAMKRIFMRYDRNVRRIRKEEAPKMLSKTETGLVHKPRYNFKRRLMIAMIIILFMTFLSGWNGTFRSKNFYGKVFHDSTQIFASDIENCPQTIECKYALDHVPEEYELLEFDSSPADVYTLYMNKTNKHTITLYQCVKADYIPHLNTEYNPIQKVDINGTECLCIDFSDYTHDSSLIVWDNGDYIIEISADLDKESIIELSKIHKI